MAIFYDHSPDETIEIYNAAQKWKNSCLIEDGSILWPGEPIWSLDNLKKIKEVYVDQPDLSKKSFEEKLELQLKGQNEDIYKLVCECLFVYYLFPKNIKYKTKLNKLDQISSWKQTSIDEEMEILEGLKNGIGNPGTSYSTRKPDELTYLVLLGIKIKEKSIPIRKVLLSDSDKTQELFDEVRKDVKSSYNINVQIRHVLLHLLFPEKYERIASSEQKRKILKEFNDFLPDEKLKQDQGLFLIREKLEERYPGKKIDFYRSPIKEMWNGDEPEPSLPPDEDDDDSDIQYFWLTCKPSIWSVESIKDGGEVFYTAYNEKGNRRRIFHAFETAQPGDRVLFYESHPNKNIVAEGEVTKGLHWEEHEGFPSGVEGVTFRYIREVAPIHWEQIINVEELEESSPVKNGAQGSLFQLTQEQYEDILALEEIELVDPVNVIHSVDFTKQPDLESLHFTDKEMILKQVKNALQAGKNIIFTGPPGTGKSKLAKEICQNYVGEDYLMTTATSEWSTYETIGGYRPNQDGTLSFRQGVFLNCFKDERTFQPQNKWLIIDEINRSDIDKAFGALFSALTGDPITLNFQSELGNQLLIRPQGTDLQVTPNDYEYIVPKDWRLIGTMNTMDKASLYELSYAFMRRFAFIPVGVPRTLSEEVVELYLEKWDLLDYPYTDALAFIWEQINVYRQIGPAIVEDIAKYSAIDGDFTSAIILYVLPQFEGLLEHEILEFIERLGQGEFIDRERLQLFAKDFFHIKE